MADHGCRFGSGRGGIGPGHGGHGPQVGGSGCRFGPQSGSFYGPFGQYFDNHVDHHAFQHGPLQCGFAHGPHQHSVQHGPYKHEDHHGPHQHGFQHGSHPHGVQHGSHQHGIHHGPHQHGFPHGQHQQSHFCNRADFEDTQDNDPDSVNENCDREYDQQCHRGHCKKDMQHKHQHLHHSKKVHKNSLDPVWTIVEKNDGKFTISIALCKETKPEDVRLNVRERDIYIEIKMEKRSEDGTSQLNQVFTKKFALPEGVVMEEIKGTFTPEHVLRIEASIPISEEIIIPVMVDEED